MDFLEDWLWKRRTPRLVDAMSGTRWTDTPVGPAPGFKNDFSGAGSLRSPLDEKYWRLADVDSKENDIMGFLGRPWPDQRHDGDAALTEWIQQAPRPLLQQLTGQHLDKELNLWRLKMLLSPENRNTKDAAAHGMGNTQMLWDEMDRTQLGGRYGKVM